MKKFEPVTFDYRLCRKQVEELRALLASKDELSERGDVLPFFQDREQLAILMGMFNQRIAWADRIAWEFDIFGDFACDLAIGEKDRGAYCLVEFEDAASNSVFQRQGEKATREWGKKFDHGYSQIIDWAHKLNDLKLTNTVFARFDRHEISYELVLVIGRDKHLDGGEKQRLNWRSENVLVDSKKVICMTFDELLSQLTVRLQALAAVEQCTLEAVKTSGGSTPRDAASGKAPPSPDPPEGQAP
ncbi:MAG: DUF4263 domain-containing protein [Gemmataceae bacterium]|nr:DUF4263 domain-containing protein [Gemmataceae bacterium]